MFSWELVKCTASEMNEIGELWETTFMRNGRHNYKNPVLVVGNKAIRLISFPNILVVGNVHVSIKPNIKKCLEVAIDQFAL